ncbi:restriction endonuclease subunit S [Enterococcus hirae]
MSNDTQPEIRFPEFTDEWEQRKLGDVVLVMDGDRGKNYPSSGDFYEKEHTLFLSAANITKNGFSFDINQYITEEKSNSMGNGKLEANDIVLTSRGSLGHIAWYDKDIKEKVPFARINSGMLILRSNDKFEASFIAQYLKSPLGKCQIDLISFGSAQPQLTKKDVLKYKISLPNKDEKMKLGIFFTNLDKIIALHQRKLDLLKETKKGFLQKMFPKNGAKVPEIRFPGFTEDWEQRKLGDLTTWTKGQGLTKEDLNKERDGSEAVHYADLYKFSPVMHEVIHWTNSDDGRIIPDNSLLFPASDVTPVGLARTSTLRLSGVKAGGDVIIGQLNESINSSFMSYQINANSKKILPLITGTTVKHIQAKSLATVSVSITNMAEQTAIAGIFEQLDDTITLHQRKLDLLKETKKGFLQKMFV